MDTELVFEWDERKRRVNLRKHKLDFVDCATVFCGPVVTVIDDRYGYGEARFQTPGLLRGKLVAVAHTAESGVIRVISMRKATTHEEADYCEKAFQD